MVLPSLSYLLLCYGLMFCLQNKLPILYEKHPFIDALLSCPYCTGFHCGWISWLIAFGVFHDIARPTGIFWFAIPAAMIAWGFCSAAFCYVVDIVSVWIEHNTPVRK